MFSPGGLHSLDSESDFKIMEELTYHQSLQSSLSLLVSVSRLLTNKRREPLALLPPRCGRIFPTLPDPAPLTQDK